MTIIVSDGKVVCASDNYPSFYIHNSEGNENEKQVKICQNKRYFDVWIKPFYYLSPGEQFLLQMVSKLFVFQSTQKINHCAFTAIIFFYDPIVEGERNFSGDMCLFFECFLY